MVPGEWQALACTREAPFVPSAYANEAAQVCVPATCTAQIQTGCGLGIGDP